MKVQVEILHRFASAVLEKTGLSRAHAETTAEVLLFADERQTGVGGDEPAVGGDPRRRAGCPLS